tara:strand:- start:585 stop:1127 length:543 start_codon:yes stop_codon:yes gene_type:complete
MAAAAANIFYLGAIQEGVLELSREDTEYMGTTFPRVVELISPASVGMRFSGQMDELYVGNLRIAIGQDGVVDDADADQHYIYPGAACAFDAVMGSLVIRRKRCDNAVMEAALYKTVGSGALSIGGDAAVVGTSVEFAALDDSNGDFGGDTDKPLGHIYAPFADGGSDPEGAGSSRNPNAA